MDSSKAITFRPGSDADLLEALAFALHVSRNEALRQGLHALAEKEPRVQKILATLAELKEEQKERPVTLSDLEREKLLQVAEKGGTIKIPGWAAADVAAELRAYAETLDEQGRTDKAIILRHNAADLEETT